MPFLRWVDRLPRPYKRAIVIAGDLTIGLVATQLAYWLRLSDWTVPFGNRWLSFAIAPPLAVVTLYASGQYRAIFRYLNSATIVALARAISIYGLLYAAFFTVVSIPDVPRTVGIIQPLLFLIMVILARSVAGPLLGGRRGDDKGSARKAIIFGAGAAGRQLEAALERAHEMDIVGFVDDDPSLHGSVLNGIAIHSPAGLPELARRTRATDLLLAIPSASAKRRAEIIAEASELLLRIRSVPGFADIANGKVEIDTLHEPDMVELLGRDSVGPTEELLCRDITGKTVLVTGAGGSIGSELCRQIATLKPARLILFDNSEFNLYAIHHELEGAHGVQLEMAPILGSVLNRSLVDRLFTEHRIDTIYHAAAYKHVPLVEANISEGVLNNAIGTWRMVTIAEAHNVPRFVLVSTDKAVRPTNVMGASKRFAEQILQARAGGARATCFAMVRFGNVLGSSGSVVPLFRNQIRNGGPITITHREITRYFMTIPEAAQLVIQAGAMSAGGDLFLLDMGEPVKIIDLARRMIQLKGLTEKTDWNPDGDIEIKVVGLRPGEKLYEELLIGANPAPTEHPLIMKAREGFMDWSLLEDRLTALEAAAVEGDEARVTEILQEVVPEFAWKPQRGTADEASFPALASY